MGRWAHEWITVLSWLRRAEWNHTRFLFIIPPPLHQHHWLFWDLLNTAWKESKRYGILCDSWVTLSKDCTGAVHLCAGSVRATWDLPEENVDRAWRLCWYSMRAVWDSWRAAWGLLKDSVTPSHMRAEWDWQKKIETGKRKRKFLMNGEIQRIKTWEGYQLCLWIVSRSYWTSTGTRTNTWCTWQHNVPRQEWFVWDSLLIFFLLRCLIASLWFAPRKSLPSLSAKWNDLKLLEVAGLMSDISLHR